MADEPSKTPDARGGSEGSEGALSAATAAMMQRGRRLVALIALADQPLQLQIVGRMLFHAALVGLGAGVVGCLFFAGSELLQLLLVEQQAGYEPLRAHGEHVWHMTPAAQTRLWLLVLIPAAGGLFAGWLTRFAPECRGGGGDAAIHAFHHHGGAVRRRVLWIKSLASIATLGTGGSGGREGPTMHIGASLGSTVGHYLRVGPRERRVLMVAGIAAGISAVFRAPLGAALIAIEMLYRDDFESEALIPAVLASVIAYSVSISVFGQSTLFGYLSPHTFRPQHIPLYIGLALFISIAAALFVTVMRTVQGVAARSRVPEWLRPAVGGLLLGGFVVLLIEMFEMWGRPSVLGLGGLGGGYGIAQLAITNGSDIVGVGWGGVQVLLVLAAAKVVATSLTIGSGGSAGDFAPALTIGALLGGAFGLAARIALDDATIQPGAFALVGMAAFYGGLAKTPLATLVLVSEMAGSYDLLVPLMLAEAVAFGLLRRVSLYPAQPETMRDSPVHTVHADPLAQVRCGDLVQRDQPITRLSPEMSLRELANRADAALEQDVFPVVDGAGVLCGVVPAEALRILASNPELDNVAVVADIMLPPASVRDDQSLRVAAQLMIARDLRCVPVTNAAGTIIGLLDEHVISATVLAGAEVAA